MANRLVDQIALRPDVGRALRSTVAFTIPLVICHALHRPADALFTAMVAQNLTLQDLRGAYPVRLTILATMTFVAAGSALLGALSADSTLAATLGMGAIALLGGCWRHLSADYGPGMGIFSALIFLLALNQPGGWPTGLHLVALVGLGGAMATLIQVGFWLFRPQHPIRYSVAETWVALSDLIASMRPSARDDTSSAAASFANCESELRAALDRTFLILGAAEKQHNSPLIKQLEEMRREVVHSAMRILALNTALEAVTNRPDFKRNLPVLDSVLKTLSDTARSIAVTLITHRTQNFAATRVRLRRCEHLIHVLDEQIASFPITDAAIAQLRVSLEQINKAIPRIPVALDKMVDHSPSRLHFPTTLPDLSSRSVQSLATWINHEPRLDPVLVRYSSRIAVLTMFAVALYKGFNIPRGYWIAFTIAVVLQPDYGSTRQRAGHRIFGTLAGGIIASALLWLRLPIFVLDTLAALTSFGFAYYLRRKYWLAIFFVTIMLVFLTNTMAPVHLEFTIARLLSTLLGGALALIAALFFWPAWEKEKFGTLLVDAINANRIYLDSISIWLGFEGATKTTPLMAKRRAENANRFAAASLERLLAEPSGRNENPERAAALATYNQRITRTLTALAVLLQDGKRTSLPDISAIVHQMNLTLESLAHAIESGFQEAAMAEVDANLHKLELNVSNTKGTTSREQTALPSADTLIWTQLAKTIAEIQAMILAIKMPG
jgi:uncharacterized membrane protein YccC